MAKLKLSKQQNYKSYQMFGSGLWRRSVRDHVHKDICAHVGVSDVAWSTQSVSGSKQEERDILENHNVEEG